MSTPFADLLSKGRTFRTLTNERRARAFDSLYSCLRTARAISMGHVGGVGYGSSSSPAGSWLSTERGISNASFGIFLPKVGHDLRAVSAPCLIEVRSATSARASKSIYRTRFCSQRACSCPTSSASGWMVTFSSSLGTFSLLASSSALGDSFQKSSNTTEIVTRITSWRRVLLDQ